jgi:hypothetical protein
MPYRINAPNDHAAYVAADANEVDALAAAARSRRRNTRGVVAGVFAAITAMPWLLGPSRLNTPVIHCHNVEIRWENAPQLPPNRWTRCVAR